MLPRLMASHRRGYVFLGFFFFHFSIKPCIVGNRADKTSLYEINKGA